MKFFFELLTKKIGFSRIGRISLSKGSKKFISTPNIIIPINKTTVRQIDFIRQFENQELFLISKEYFLKIGFLREKFKNTGFLFGYKGTIRKFQEILAKNITIFSEDKVIAIIPFNIPTTTISKEFSKKEIKNYLNLAEQILRNYSSINFGLSIKIFDNSELIDLYIQFIKNFDNIKMINLIDIFDNFNNFRNIIKIIVKIKDELDNNIVLLASGRITPKHYPMLVYLGIDLIDSSYLLYLSTENFYDTIEYLLPIYKIRFLPCSCVACEGRLKDLLEHKYSSEKIELLCLHNLISASTYMKKIKQYLNYEDYRAFVEKSSFDNMNIISMLKILDKQYSERIRYETPIVQEKKIIKCHGPLSYNRPDFEEFRKRIIKNFQPEPWTSLIIILPCSAKKPYSESKSHRKFHGVIRKFSKFPAFQEIILTSPLGAIPRQLENVYPVNSYDISVTGEWDFEETLIAARMLDDLLEKYDKDIPIICHLEKDYLKIIKETKAIHQRKMHFSEIKDKTISKESLQSLEGLIRKHEDHYSKNKIISENDHAIKSWTRKFVKILEYQFGIGSGNKLFSNGLNLKHDKNKTKIRLLDPITNKLLGVFKFSTGQIILTTTGTKRILPFLIKSNVIVFNGEKFSGNNLFRPGILEYSPGLIPLEQVIILNKEKNDVIGLGQMIVGAKFLEHTKTGKVVKIHERK